VHKAFLEIARTEGQKSQDKKKALINKLLVAAGQNEAGYIMRCLQVGFSLATPLGLSIGRCCDVRFTHNSRPSGVFQSVIIVGGIGTL
jgi:hypothetical protein